MKKIIAVCAVLVGIAPFVASAAPVGAGMGIKADARLRVGSTTPASARMEFRASTTLSTSSRPMMKEQREENQAARQADRQENRINKATTRADREIAVRVASLNHLISRIQGMKNVSSSTKAIITAEIQAEIILLNSLKGKITAEASSTTTLSSSTALAADIKSITTANRVYALIIPQMTILAAADRAETLVASFTTVSAKLQARISAATSTASTSGLTATLADLNAKIADAHLKAQAAITAVTGLKADNGDATIAAANKAALETARAAIKATQNDFQIAEKDARTILKAIQGNAGQNEIKIRSNINGKGDRNDDGIRATTTATTTASSTI